MGNQRKGKDVIELGELDDEDLTPIKWRDFEMHHLIAIQGKLNNNFVKTTNKQAKILKRASIFFYKNMNASKYWLYVGQKISMYDEAIEGICPNNGLG